MTRQTTIVGKWRLTAMSTWDRDYIDLVEPGFIAFAVRDRGEMAFGVVTATSTAPSTRPDATSASTSPALTKTMRSQAKALAEMSSPDTITGEIEFRNGDDTTFEARRW